VESALTYRRKFRLPLNARGHHVLADFSGSVPRCLTVLDQRPMRQSWVQVIFHPGAAVPNMRLTPHVDWLGENVLVRKLGPARSRGCLIIIIF